MIKLTDFFRRKPKKVKSNDSINDEQLIDYVRNNTVNLEDLYRRGNLLGDKNDVKLPAKNSYLVYKCSQVWSEYVPQVDLKFYNKSNDDEIDMDTNEAVRFLMNPNSEMTWYEFLSRSILFYVLYGESFWFWKDNVGSELGVSKIPDSLLILTPYNMLEVLDGYNDLEAWSYSGNYQGEERDRIIPKQNIIQVKNSNPYNEYRGIEVTQVLSNVIGVDYKSTLEILRFYDNFAMPGSIIVAPPEAKVNEAAMKSYIDKFNSLFKGADNKYKTAGFTGGIDIKTLGVTHDKQQLIELKNWVRDTILAVMNVPHTFAGYMGANRAEAEQQAANFWQAAKSLLKRFEMSINNKILSRMDDTIYCRFDYDSIESLKPQIDAQTAQLYLTMGYTADDIVTLYNVDLPSHPGITDKHYQPFNLIEVGTETETPTENKVDIIENKVETKRNRISKKGFAQAHLALHRRQENILKKNLENYLNLQRSKVLKKINKENSKDFDHFQNDEMSKIKLYVIIEALKQLFENEDQRLRNRVTKIYEDTTERAQKSVHKVLSIDRDLILNTKIINERLNLITGVNDTAFKRIKKQMFEGVNNGETLDQISDRIKKVYQVNDKRAMLIARTETTNIISAATNDEYKANNVAEKEWLTVGDDRVRDSCRAAEADGPIPVDNTFSNGHAHPTEPNCRCALAPVIR